MTQFGTRPRPWWPVEPKPAPKATWDQIARAEMDRSPFCASRPEPKKPHACPASTRVLSVMTREPMTTRQIADRAGEKPKKIKQRLQLLRSKGLIVSMNHPGPGLLWRLK